MLLGGAERMRYQDKLNWADSTPLLGIDHDINWRIFLGRREHSYALGLADLSEVLVIENFLFLTGKCNTMRAPVNFRPR